MYQLVDTISQSYRVNRPFLKNIEAFYKSSKKGCIKGLDELQSISTSPNSEQDEGNG